MQEAQLLSTGQRSSNAQYGSDYIVELFASLGIPYVALNPGSSYRGLHDSLVNFDAPGKPEMVVCCHEEIAVALAAGFARATAKPMLAALHNVVGLQHATMAIFNAWVDRLPMLVIGGTGPMATENRRNHIDWVHTANVQGNIVRDIVKWDDQPASVAGFSESVMRGHRITTTEPRGPVYLCFDADLQEAPVTAPLALPDVSKFATPAPVGPDPDALRGVAEMLVAAESPVLLAGSIGRFPETLPAFEELAQLLQAPVLLSGGNYVLPGDHPLMMPSSLRTSVLGDADLLLALDVFDLAAALGPGTTPELNNAPYINPQAKVIDVSVWGLTQKSLIADYEVLYPTDVSIAADSRVSVPMLRDFVRSAIAADTGARRRIEDRARAVQRLQDEARTQREAAERRGWDAKPISMERVSYELSQVVKERGLPWTLVGAGRGAGFEATTPEQVIPGGGGHRGGGLGEEIGSAIGAALALRGSGRLCINTLGDGNLLYTPSALWTAANLKLPLLTIVNNNFAYGNDEGHQEHMARMRGRPIENKGIGIYIDDPRTDFTHLAQAFNVEGIGPVIEPEDIRPAMERAVDAATEGRPVLVDVHSRRGRGG